MAALTGDPRRRQGILLVVIGALIVTLSIPTVLLNDADEKIGRLNLPAGVYLPVLMGAGAILFVVGVVMLLRKS
ncbi:hypothetical protein [Microbacterium sp. NPDC064584]|uniref:hypothetical protein n=1 Tax=Microbacterium sp. NPDC064584 TaxID=3155817 RepID=UPI00341DC75B